MHRRCRAKLSVDISASLTSKHTFGFLHTGRRSRCRLLLWRRHVQESACIVEKSYWREGEWREGRPARHAVMAADTNTGPQRSPVSCSCWSHWCYSHYQPQCSKSLKWHTVNNTKTVILILFGVVYFVWYDMIPLSEYQLSPPSGVSVASGLIYTQTSWGTVDQAETMFSWRKCAGQWWWSTAGDQQTGTNPEDWNC